MKPGKNEFTCPWCFEIRSVSSIEFRCEQSDCALEQDTLLSEYLGVDVDRPHVFSAKKGIFQGLVRKASCDQCAKPSSQRICPACHNALPYSVGEGEDKIFAVIGAKESGKSHYIAVLIDSLRNRVAPAFNCCLNSMDDDTITRYEQDFYLPVFDRRETIPVTRSAKADIKVRQPLVFSFSVMKKDLFGRSKNTRSATLCFFDTAGEDLLSEQTMTRFSKYISNAQGLILLIDPLQFSEARLQLGKDLVEDSANNFSILDRTINLIRKEHELKQDQKIPIPIALAFSKLDGFEALLDPGSPLRNESPHISGKNFDQDDFKAVQTELDTLLTDSWGQGGIKQNLQKNFTDHALFAISALGCEPGGTAKIARFRPRRVTDPLLWLLWKHNLI